MVYHPETPPQWPNEYFPPSFKVQIGFKVGTSTLLAFLQHYRIRTTVKGNYGEEMF